MTSWPHAFVLSATVLSLCFLVACQRHWDLIVVDVRDRQPVFCFSTLLGQCVNRGDRFIAIEIEEASKHGERLRIMWSIVCDPLNNVDNCVLKTLEYGILPRGWKERQPAKQLSSNTYYSVNDLYYFSRNDKGDYSVIEQGQFYKKVRGGE